MTIRTILDTDIGTDVDDCLAIGFMLGSPEFDIEGITCVYGDVELRGKMVRKLLSLAGRSEVPVHLGVRPPLLGTRPVYWGGHEGVGLLDGSEDGTFPEEHAVDFIIRTVMESPGEIHLLAIGPLTNIALAIRKEPRIVDRLVDLTIMGGVFRGPSEPHLPLAEHNIICDPEAAQIVLSSGAPITLVPLDVTTQCWIKRPDLERLLAVGDPLRNAIADQVARYPRFAQRGQTVLHDPLAAAVVIDPTLVEKVPLHVAVETQGRLTTGMTVIRKPTDDLPATAEVALKVDAERAEKFILDRLTG